VLTETEAAVLHEARDGKPYFELSIISELHLQSPIVGMICEEDATKCEERADEDSPKRSGDFFDIRREQID